MFFYRVYPYAPLATLFSVIMRLLAFFAAIGAICLCSNIKENPIMAVPGVICAAAALFFWLFLSNKTADKLAEKEGGENIRNKHKYAHMYCGKHPEAYEQLLEENQEYAREMRTNVSYALQYCKAHPEIYDRLAAENMKFGEKYKLDDNGKVVKNK